MEGGREGGEGRGGEQARARGGAAAAICVSTGPIRNVALLAEPRKVHELSVELRML